MKNPFTAWGKRNLTIMGEILNIKNTHSAEIYLLSQFMCSTKDVHKRN
jgi:hypothetical protein